MNKNINIVLVVVVLGALFAIGVNRWVHVYDKGEKSLSYTRSTYKENPTARHTQVQFERNGRPIVQAGKENKVPVFRNTNNRILNRNIAAYRINDPDLTGYSQQQSTSTGHFHLSSNSTLHSVGGGMSGANTTNKTKNISTRNNGSYSGYIAAITIPSYSTTSYISRSYLNNQNTSAVETIRAAARQNFIYGINTPLLYDMGSPVTYYNDFNNINNFNNLNNKNLGGTRRRASTLAEAWIELYQAHHGGALPTDEELNDFIDWWLGQGFLAPTVDPDPDPDPGIPGLYDAWLEMFRTEIGRDPVDFAELEAYIKWKMGEGPFSPYDDLPLGNIPWILFALLLTAYCTLKKFKSFNIIHLNYLIYFTT